MSKHSKRFTNLCIIICIYLFQINGLSAQDQRVADSLKNIYLNTDLNGENKLELLRELSFNELKDIELSLTYANELISLSLLENNYKYLYRGYLQKGHTLRLKGDFQEALDAFFKCTEAAIKAKYIEGEGLAYTAIADIYSEMGNTENAASYYSKAITILRKTEDSQSLATTLLNAGDEAFNNKQYELALDYFEESGEIFKKDNYLIGTAYNLGNIGMVYAEQGKDELAKTNINEAVGILEELQDYYSISIYLTYTSDIYAKQKDYTTALAYAQRSLDLANQYKLKDQISESNLALSELHEEMGNKEEAFAAYKAHIVYRDSVKNLETIQKNALQQTKFEVSQKQAEVDKANIQKRNQQIVLGFSGLLLATLFWYYRTISREKKKSEKLLLNILPSETAEELKKYGKVKARKFDSVTVLFTDFKGFTNYAENLSPEELVKSVDFYFSKFDEIMEKHGIEKIKTVGDAYMCAAGLRENTNNHALKMTDAAFEIASFVEESKKNDPEDQTRFEVRIGLNTGPVVAGVVGTKKFAYDIWGDTVNVASRMESMSEAGRVNISEQTYALIKDQYTCEFRGEYEVKNKGKMKMYYALHPVQATT